jgi:hypothetical protein
MLLVRKRPWERRTNLQNDVSATDLTESYPWQHRTNLCTCKDDISNQLYLPEASGDAGHGEGDQMVQVTIGGSSQLQGSEMKQQSQDL